MLSDAKKEKITFIEDINKAKLFLYDSRLTVQEFDDLYDMDNVELWYIAKDLDSQIQLARYNKLEKH